MRSELLLHACCAPCASSVLEKLTEEYKVTVYFANPNIQPKDEYELRLKQFDLLAVKFKFDLNVPKYSTKEWLKVAGGMSSDPERGDRCRSCIRLRLKDSAKFAQKNKIKHFSTTLTVSPQKDSKMIIDSGKELALEYGLTFLDTDFKKKNGYPRTVELSKELKLYRQKYCGCLYSL